MTSIFNIVSATPVAPALDSASRPVSLVQGDVAKDGALAAESAVVDIGKQPLEALTYTAPAPVVQQVWTAGTGDDAVSKRIAENYATTDVSRRLSGLGSALLDGYTGEAGAYRQALLSFAGQPGSKAAEQARQAAEIELQVAPTQKLALTLKTRSGATVELSLASSISGLGVEMKTSQTLTDKELKAVKALADGFETALKSLAEQPPRIAIDELTRFDSSAIASLDLSASFSKEIGDPLSLTFSATAAGRKLSVETAGGVLDLSVDLANSEIRGDNAQRAKAMSNYLAQVDVAAKRGNGDKALVELFKNAFSEMHAYYPDDPTAVSRRPLRDYEAAALSGLTDFKASIKSTVVASNPMRVAEVDYFNYKTSQESTIETGARTRLTQSQETSLDAAFHKGLKSDKAPLLTLDPKSQNYRYIEVNDRISSKVTIEHDEFGPVRAEHEQSVSKVMGIQTYERGKLVKQEQIPEQNSFIIDLLDTIKSLSLDPNERQKQLEALNDRILLRG
jgi:hypothetical protein